VSFRPVRRSNRHCRARVGNSETSTTTARSSAVAVNNGAPVLLKNAAASGNHGLVYDWWVKHVIPCDRARLVCKQAPSAQPLEKRRSSYLSITIRVKVLGWAYTGKIDKLEIRWPLPSRRRDTFEMSASTLRHTCRRYWAEIMYEHRMSPFSASDSVTENRHSVGRIELVGRPQTRAAP